MINNIELYIMKNKTALITGSSRGIGKAIALQLAHDGFDIVLHYKSNKESAEQVKQEIESLGRTVYLLSADVRDKDALVKMFDELSNKIDSLDVLVNNVGFDYDKTIENYELDEIQSVIDIVLTSKIVTTKLALPLLKKSEAPKIINIASRMGIGSLVPNIAPYAAAEAGVIRFSGACVKELSKKYNLRVNTIAPGLTDTDYTRNIFTDQKDWNAFAGDNPMGRVGDTKDIAKLVSFLVSKNAEYINGAVVQVTGGSHV